MATHHTNPTTTNVWSCAEHVGTAPACSTVPSTGTLCSEPACPRRGSLWTTVQHAEPEHVDPIGSVLPASYPSDIGAARQHAATGAIARVIVAMVDAQGFTYADALRIAAEHHGAIVRGDLPCAYCARDCVGYAPATHAVLGHVGDPAQYVACTDCADILRTDDAEQVRPLG